MWWLGWPLVLGCFAVFGLLIWLSHTSRRRRP